MRTIRLILSDKFIWLLTIAVFLATFLPVSGQAVPYAIICSFRRDFLDFLASRYPAGTEGGCRGVSELAIAIDDFRICVRSHDGGWPDIVAGA